MSDLAPIAALPDEELYEDELAYLDPENNEGELTIALRKIEKVMQKGWSFERAAIAFGIRGHPYFAAFWPVTTYWGDARVAREVLGLALDS